MLKYWGQVLVLVVLRPQTPCLFSWSWLSLDLGLDFNAPSWRFGSVLVLVNRVQYWVSVSQFLSQTGVYWIQSNFNAARTPVVILRKFSWKSVKFPSSRLASVIYLFIHLVIQSSICLFLPCQLQPSSSLWGHNFSRGHWHPHAPVVLSLITVCLPPLEFEGLSFSPCQLSVYLLTQHQRMEVNLLRSFVFL